MKISRIILIFCLISVLSCATRKNNSGYVITNKSFETPDGKKNAVYKQTYCNDQKAVAWYKVNGFNYLGFVYLNLKNKKYVLQINNKNYVIDIDKIMPHDIGQSEALKIAQNAGFSSYSEFRDNFEKQQKLAQEERKRQENLAREEKRRQENLVREEKRRQEEERRLELIRLREEIDKKFGVVAIGSLLHAKNGELKIGDIIRLGDTFSYYMNSWSRSSTGSYLFGDFNEFEICGLDMRQVKVKEILPDISSLYYQGGSFSIGGRRGYIVKYLGTKDVITQAGLRKVIWVFECIGGNIYAE